MSILLLIAKFEISYWLIIKIKWKGRHPNSRSANATRDKRDQSKYVEDDSQSQQEDYDRPNAIVSSAQRNIWSEIDESQYEAMNLGSV